MDPDACLQRLLDAFRDGDRHTAIEALEDLAVWIIKGGAFPEDPRGIQHPVNIEHFHRQMVELTRLLNEYRDGKVDTSRDRIPALGAVVFQRPSLADFPTLIAHIARLWAELHEADQALALELARKLPTMEIKHTDED